MPSFRRNVQSRPTSTYYEKKEQGEIFSIFFAENNFVLISSELRTITIPVGFYSGEARNDFLLIDSILSTPPGPVDLGTYTNEAQNDFLLLSSELREIVIPLGTYPGEFSNDFLLLSSELKTRVFSVGTYPNALQNDFRLISSSLV